MLSVNYDLNAKEDIEFCNLAKININDFVKDETYPTFEIMREVKKYIASFFKNEDELYDVTDSTSFEGTLYEQNIVGEINRREKDFVSYVVGSATAYDTNSNRIPLLLEKTWNVETMSYEQKFMTLNEMYKYITRDIGVSISIESLREEIQHTKEISLKEIAYKIAKKL